MATPNPLPEQAAATDHSLRILVIDDNPSDREFYSRCLKNRGCQVVTASTGEEGTRKFAQQPVDCVLLDYNLPRWDGLDVLTAFVMDPHRSPVPIIMVTGQGSEDIAVSAWKNGAADYLSKDVVSPEAIHRAVINAVEKNRLRMEVAAHAADLANTNDTLRKRNAEIKRFYHTVSHEIKTPLAAAREFVSLVQDGVAGPVSEQQAEFLDYALSSCDQLAEHPHDTIESARLDNSKLKLKLGPFQISGAVNRALASNAAAAREKSVTIQTRIPDDIADVVGDENRIVQVLCNLLNNALKWSEENSKILLEVTLVDEGVDVSVIDEGPGIDPAHHTGIFERLYQVTEDPHINGGGLGLGLSIAQELVRQHGSKIRLDSALGKGSTFTFHLPFAERYRSGDSE